MSAPLSRDVVEVRYGLGPAADASAVAKTTDATPATTCERALRGRLPRLARDPPVPSAAADPAPSAHTGRDTPIMEAHAKPRWRSFDAVEHGIGSLAREFHPLRLHAWVVLGRLHEIHEAGNCGVEAILKLGVRDASVVVESLMGPGE
jgi:hypothetical protein